MKTIIFIIVILTLMAFNSSAQDYNSTGEVRTNLNWGLQIGLKLGANYSNIYAIKGEDFKAFGKFGLATGAFVEVPITKYFGFHPEILFSQKGFKATSVILGSPYDYTRTSNYIDVPILFAFKPLQYVTLLAGPQYSYLIKQKDAFLNSNSDVQQEQIFENNNVRRHTFAFSCGADVNIKNLVLSGRVGLDFQDNKGDGTSTNPQYKNIWYQFTFGYRLY